MDPSLATPPDAASTAAGLAIVGVMLLFQLAVLVFIVACFWKINTKAGKPGWSAIVPIYNLMVLCEIVGKPTWWWLLLLVPFYGIYVGIVLVHGISLSFGKSTGFTLGLLFLGFIFYPLLAFGDARYQGPAYAQPVLAVGR